MFKAFFIVLLCSLAIIAQPANTTARRSKPEIKNPNLEFKDLPQKMPAEPRLTTDAQDMRVKGKVRTMTLRHFDGAGERMFTEESHFNERGDLVRVLFYDVLGNLTYINYFGYIDDKRVSLKTFPARKDQALPRAGYDTEYSYAYDDSGQLSGKNVKNEKGEGLTGYGYGGKGRSYVASYSNPRENFFSSSSVVLNDKNDPATITYLENESDGPGPMMTVRVKTVSKYAYEKYDAQGNWIAMTVTNTTTVKNSASTSSKRSELREFSYYP